MEEVLYGVAKEALVNIERHARARMVLVGLNNSADHLDMVIQDDGDGAPELLLQHLSESGTHFGLNSMKRQMEAVGGTLTVANGDDGGFAVRVRVPV